MKYPVAFSWEGEIIWHCEAENRLTGSKPYLERDPMIKRALNYLRKDGIPAKYAPYIKDFIAKYEMNRAWWNIKAGRSSVARDILKECDTNLFFRRKVSLVLLSLVPFSLLRLLMDNAEILQDLLDALSNLI